MPKAGAAEGFLRRGVMEQQVLGGLQQGFAGFAGECTPHVNGQWRWGLGAGGRRPGQATSIPEPVLLNRLYVARFPGPTSAIAPLPRTLNAPRARSAPTPLPRPDRIPAA